MQSISLATAIAWRQKLVGEHPLFNMKHPAGMPETTAFKELRSRASRFKVKPTDYSMSMLEMGVLCKLLEISRPETVVEFGCGVSTELLLAIQATHGYPARIVSFDQSEEYITELRMRLAERGVSEGRRFTIVHAPLVNIDLDGSSLKFYDPSIIGQALESLHGAIDLFLADGPSGGGWNRLLAGLVAAYWGEKGSTLVLHDALRDWELSSATVWESLDWTRSTRVYPYGHGLLQAVVQPLGPAKKTDFMACARNAMLALAMKGDAVSLQDAMTAAGDVVSNVRRKRVPVTPRVLEQLPGRAVFAARDKPFRMQKPRNLHQLDSAQHERLLMRDVVSTLPGGKLWHLGGVVLTGRSQILCGESLVAENMEGEYGWQGLVRRGKSWELEIDRDLDIVETPSLIIEKFGVKNYALWWMEVLPRVFFAYHLARNAPRRILLNESRHLDDATRRFHEETLRLVAGDDVEISYARKDTLVTNAWLPNVSHFARSKTRWNAHTREFRDFILSACTSRLKKSRYAESTHRKLFVMRQDSHARRLTNTDELVDALAKRHVFAVTPGQLDWIDQIALFSRARVVSGVHGAGLLNLLWCSPGTQCLEAFTPPTLNRNTFRHIASQLDLPYRVYVEEASRVVNNPSGTDTIALTLDVQRFMSLLDEAIKAYRSERSWIARLQRRVAY
jgi:hypothetical protein